MKTIVTGGCGFIGSHLVDRLINDKHDVIVIDDMSGENEQFHFNDKAVYHNNSVQDFYDIEPLFENIDVVFHLAAESKIQSCINNPLMANLINVVGTCSILQAAKQHDVKRVIYSSTAAVYGLKDALPITEKCSVDCLNPYSASKYAGEELCKMFYRLYGLETIILRYFNVYGDRQANNGQYTPVIAAFQRQLQEEEPLTIIGNGLQTRDFVHVLDVIEANIAASMSTNRIAGEIFNIASGKNYSIMELLWMIAGKDAFWISKPERIGEVMHSIADITKAKNILNWEPKINLQEWINENISTVSDTEQAG